MHLIGFGRYLYFFCDNIANKIFPFPCEGI